MSHIATATNIIYNFILLFYYLKMEASNSVAFYPFRTVFGKDSDVKGVYLEKEMLVIQNHKNRDHKSTVFVPYGNISQIAHIAKFKFIFLVVMWSTQITHKIGFFDQNNEIIGSFEVNSFNKNVLIELLTKLSEKEITFDATLTSTVEEKSIKPIRKNYFKAVWKGIRFWILIPITLAVFAAIIGILASIFS